MKGPGRIALLMFLLMVAGSCWAQSLGEVARKARQDKRPEAERPAKIYTNDEIPESIELQPQSKSASVDADSDERQAKAADGTTPGEAPAGDRGDRLEQFNKELSAQKKTVADLEHEIDLMEREHKLRAAAYYSDAGWQLRDSKKWFEDERKYESDLQTKKKDLEEAKQKLEQLLEDGRKAGVPSSMLELPR